MKKKLLVYANYFYPEVASTGQILTDLCVGLANKYDITVICSVPCYNNKIDNKYKDKKFYYEKYKRINIIRVRVKEVNKKSKLSRIKHILSYFINSISITKKIGKYDLILAISQPPVLGGLLGIIGKKYTKGKLIYNIQDFNPEQIMAVNYSNNKILLKLLMLIDKKSCKKADLIVLVGHDMQDTLNNRFKNKTLNSVVINNWIDENNVYPLPKNNKDIIAFRKKYNLENKFVIMYSGNIGLYYDLENIINVLGKINDKDVSFVFIGDGCIKDKLIKIKDDNNYNNIIFIPYQDKKDIIYSLNSADVHLVSNAKGIKGVSVPSKIYGCLATNIPVLGVLEKDSEAANIINESNCGVLVETGNYNKLENEIRNIINTKDEFIKKHSTGRKYLETYLKKDISINKYYEEMEKLL